MEEYSPTEQNEILCSFYGEIRRQDGKDYEPDSLRVMQAAIHRYLSEKKYVKSIFSGIEFTSSNKVLEGKARLLRQNGMGKRPNASEPLSKDDENILLELGKLGGENPTALVHTMWFNNIQYFGQRGQQEHISMTMNNFLHKVDETSGKRYIEFINDPTKCRQNGLHHQPRSKNPKMFTTGGPRCPVMLFDLYISKRPPHLRVCGGFYLTPKKTFGTDIWYTSTPIGKNKIATFMK